MQVCLLSGDEGIRTLDLRVANASLSQLSHAPTSSQKYGDNGARTHDLSHVKRTLSQLSYASMPNIVTFFYKIATRI